ncbi:MAG: ABC transporter substrate-binding protein, partial [Candidatus Gastranaerophilaceae bacterium]
VTIYNKKLYEKAKLTGMPATYDDLAQIAHKVKTNTGKYVYLPTITENDTMLKILNKYGVTSKNINSKESVKVFESYKYLYQNGLIPAESITQTHREALEKYMSENVIFFQGGANFLTMIQDNAPDVFKVTDVAPQIKGSLGQNDFSLMNFVIPLKAKYKNEALEFGLYLTNKENQLELAKKTNVISTNKEALSDSFYNSNDTLTAKARSISAKQIKCIQPVMVQTTNQKDINTLINTVVQSVLLNKDTTQNILNKAAKDLEELVK